MRTTLALLIGALALSSHVQAQPREAPGFLPEIFLIRGDLYEVRLGDQSTVFLATHEGIILVDPLNATTARWLKDELPTHFPAAPVRYVVFTHHHSDRAEGGGVFDDTAELIGHEKFNRELRSSRRSHPQEVYWRVPSVESEFSDTRSIRLGDAEVDLLHLESDHAADLAGVVFRRERLAFVVDDPGLTTRPFVVNAPIEHLRDWTRTLAALDVDAVLFGDGRRMSHAEVVELNNYLETVISLTALAYESGDSLKEVQARFQLDAYRSTPHYAARNAQTAAIYERLRLQQTAITGAVMMRQSRTNSGYCQVYSSCTVPASVGAAAVGVVLSFGQHGLAAEFSADAQRRITRDSRFYSEHMNSRESRASFLWRYASRARVSNAIVAGLSVSTIDSRGYAHRRQTIGPRAGRQPVTSNTLNLGVTGGMDLAVRFVPALSLVFPVRATYLFGRAFESSDTPLGRMDVQVGVGLTVRVQKRVR